MKIVCNGVIPPNGFAIHLRGMAAMFQANEAGRSARVYDHYGCVAAASGISGALLRAAKAPQDGESLVFAQFVEHAAAQEFAGAVRILSIEAISALGG